MRTLHRLILALGLALAFIATTITPSQAWPWSPGSGDCTTTKVVTKRPAGWSSLVTVRKTTICRSESGYVTSIRTKVIHYRVPR